MVSCVYLLVEIFVISHVSSLFPILLCGFTFPSFCAFMLTCCLKFQVFDDAFSIFFFPISLVFHVFSFSFWLVELLHFFMSATECVALSQIKFSKQELEYYSDERNKGHDKCLLLNTNSLSAVEGRVRSIHCHFTLFIYLFSQRICQLSERGRGGVALNSFPSRRNARAKASLRYRN